MQLRRPASDDMMSLTLQVRQIGIVDAVFAAAFDLAPDRAGRTKEAFSNGPDRAQVIAHGHDDGAFLGDASEIALNSFRYAMYKEIRPNRQSTINVNIEPNFISTLGFRLAR
jgi:hypothetical protein